MCQQCKDLADKYYPDLSGEEKSDLLMGATCFPFCSPEALEEQLVELRESTDGSLIGALVFADAQLHKAAEFIKHKQNN